MNPELSSFAVRLCSITARPARLEEFDLLVLELFSLQFKYNSACRKNCEERKLTPQVIEHWTQIPAVPAVVFEELEITCMTALTLETCPARRMRRN